MTEASVETVGVLGLGIMGSPMARHLAARGSRVLAWDRDPSRARALAGSGVHACDSADEVATRSGVLITMLPDAETTVAVMRHLAGRFTGLWIQSATVGLEGLRDLIGLADAQNLDMIDCPLLGTKSSANAGELTSLASGPAALESKCRSVVEAYSRRVLWLGEAGCGSKLKLVMNNWVLGLTVLTAETICLAEGLGFSGDTFLDLIANGPLDVVQAHLKGDLMKQREFPAALPLRLAAKDARLITAAAAESALDLPLGRSVEHALALADAGGFGNEDVAAVYMTLSRTTAPE